MKVAVIGAGISGLVSAYVLAKAGVEVVLFEKEDYLGGHAKTVNFDGFDLDLGVMVFNRVTYPNMMEFFDDLGVETEAAEMSFSVSLDKGQGCEWGIRNGFSSIFAQKKNLLNPYFWQMIREIIKFKDEYINYLEVMENNPDIDRNETVGHFIKSRGYSELFQKGFLVPLCGSIWSCPSEEVLNFSAFMVFSFCRNHYAFQIFNRPQWLTFKRRSHSYINKVQEVLERQGCRIRTCQEVCSISTTNEGCIIRCGDDFQEIYDACVIATHAPDTLRMLGNEATYEEVRVLGNFRYVYSDIFLHRDKDFMPLNPRVWSSWNFQGSTNNKVCLTYWLNVVQNLGETDPPFLVTFNPEQEPKNVLLKWSTKHPAPCVAAFKALNEINNIQGKRRIWFCGAYQGYGFHEDGLKAGIMAAHSVLGKNFTLLNNPKHMVTSLAERTARLFVTRFFRQYISAGSLTLMEEGGTMFNFEGKSKNFIHLKVSLKIHTPQFYWKIMTRADLGLADAYINGDFSFVDKDKGLLNLFLILIASTDTNSSIEKSRRKRGWWTPPLFTAGIAFAKSFLQHALRKNTLTQARRNISLHYDLSNQLFALFLDDTMSYSCAIFKNKDEDLKVAQLRKISLLIEKAKIRKNHQVLEIGCGWGSLAIEVVKQTGCHYTGITLSEEQLKYAQEKVKDVGLQDHIKFLLCDYRQLSNTKKYDRIISCEMIEAVGHEFMEDFFGSCESVLAENGLFVLQFISVPDQCYDEFRLSPGFMKEIIFPGGCLPSLSRITTAMMASSRLCVEHLEDIGIHYHQTLRYWRKNFLNNKSKILELGFDEYFIRTWEYYFDYCAAGFKSQTIGDYQVVFSRPGIAAFNNNPYQGIPSAY